MHYSVTIDIDASAQRAWVALTDVQSYPRWTRSMTTVRRGGAGELEEGSTARVKQPWLPWTVWTVTRLEPERSFIWQSEARGVTTIAGHYLCRRAGGGVSVVLTVDQHGPLAKALSPFTAGLVRRYVDLEAAGLKRYCETVPLCGISGPRASNDQTGA